MNLIEKVEVGFCSLYQKGLSNVYIVEKVRSQGMGERIPLKRTGTERIEETGGIEEH